MEKRPVLALNWGCQKRYWYWVCQASSLISWLRRRRRRIYHIVKLVLCIQPILREQWEQISASALLKGWRINLMYMFWWWRGKPDYLEETLHTERPQWDGKLGPSRCWPLRHCAILRSRYFLHTHKSHFYCFHPVSSSSFLFFVVLSYVSQRRNVHYVRTYSDLPPSPPTQVFLSPSTIIFFNQSFMIWWKHDYCLWKR